MNLSCLSVHRSAQIAICLALAPLGAGITFAANPAPADAPPKPYVLFMGADITLAKDKVFHPVEEVTASSLVIKPGGKPVKVPLEGDVDLRINESLKIARMSLGVNGLKAERAYTLGADPFVKFSKAAALAAGEGAAAELSRIRVYDSAVGALAAAGSVAHAESLPPSQGRDALLGAAQANYASASAGQSGAYETMVEAFDRSTELKADDMRVEEGGFDAIRISFEVTSEKDLAQPYYAFIAQIRDRDSKPGQVRKWAYVKSLGSISAGVPRGVNVHRGGLPPGYILESYEVHLYNGVEELATSLSRKRVPLTSDEAMQFRIIEYIGANKGRTLPAAPVTTTLAGDVRFTLTPAQLGETNYVRVTRDGKVAAAFRDAAGKKPLNDPALEQALKTLHFKPALDAGKPVESIVPVNLDSSRPPEAGET